MSSFRIGERLDSRYTRDKEGVFLRRSAEVARKSSQLEEKARLVCRDKGLNYNLLSPVQRVFLTHYRCSVCKFVPLDRLDMTHSKKVRCGQCGHIVSFTSSGKYGKMRKKLAMMFLRLKSEEGEGGGEKEQDVS